MADPSLPYVPDNGPDHQPEESQGEGHGHALKVMASSLQECRERIKQGQYAQVLKQIVRILSMCPCKAGDKRHPKDKGCHIAQCISAVLGEDDDLYAVTQRLCACEYKWPQCSLPEHISALDVLAECQADADQYVSAFSTALGLIRLSPTSAAGYCRAGVILRDLMRRAANSEPIAQKAMSTIVNHARLKGLADFKLSWSFLRRFVEKGLYNTDQSRNGPNDSYRFILQRMAENLRIKHAGRNPAEKLPIELLTMVFSYLDTNTLLRCLYVNKNWRDFLLTETSVWDHIRLSKPEHPTGNLFNKFLRARSQDIKSFVVQEIVNFKLTVTKLNSLLHGLPNLKQLCLGTEYKILTRPDMTSGLGLPTRPGPNLTRLSLGGLFEDVCIRLIEINAQTLQVLDLVNIQGRVNRVLATTELPRLERLRFVGTEFLLHSGVGQTETALVLETVVDATPNLQRLEIDGYEVRWLFDPVNPPAVWPHLREIVLGPAASVMVSTVYGHELGFLITIAGSLRSIEVLYIKPPVSFVRTNHIAIPFYAPISEVLGQRLRQLEVFRYLGAAAPEELYNILGPATRAGNLKVLELWAGPSLRASLPWSCYNRLLNENIHTFGLHYFNWSDICDPDGFDGMPFIDLLKNCPKVHTVSVFPNADAPKAVARFMARLVCHPGIRVIRQNALKGTLRDEVLKMARKRGVDVQHVPPRQTATWVDVIKEY